MSLTTKTIRTADGSGSNPTAADLRAVLNGVPDSALVGTRVNTSHPMDRGGETTWTVTATWDEKAIKPHPSGFPAYPPGVRSVDPYSGPPR